MSLIPDPKEYTAMDHYQNGILSLKEKFPKANLKEQHVSLANEMRLEFHFRWTCFASQKSWSKCYTFNQMHMYPISTISLLLKELEEKMVEAALQGAYK